MGELLMFAQIKKLTEPTLAMKTLLLFMTLSILIDI